MTKVRSIAKPTEADLLDCWVLDSDYKSLSLDQKIRFCKLSLHILYKALAEIPIKNSRSFSVNPLPAVSGLKGIKS